MSELKYEIRAGAYFDSVVLMQLQRNLAALPDVVDAGIVMATPANQELLAASGLLPPAARQASPDDLLIVVRGQSEEAASQALGQLDRLIQQRRSTTGQDFRPRSLESAVKMLPAAGWVLVSVPGRYAAPVARQALELGRHVFLYSDNVPLADEVALKKLAAAGGLLLMGPDCGTAIVNGIGLGFANRVRRGHIGLVGASGTGLQAISSHIHGLGAGISQALGTGGRDLTAEVGGITARQALALLDQDPETEVIVLVSKPPATNVAARLMAAAQNAGKPVVVYFLGFPPPARQLGNVSFALNLRQAATLAVELANPLDLPPRIHNPRLAMSAPFVRGLFSGGTLAYEMVLGLQAVLDNLYSNTPVQPGQALAELGRSRAHTILDMGADAFTQGRLHPMLDNDLRLRRLKQEAAEPDVGLILLDVVLGEGAHPDPASELAPAIAGIKAQRDLEVAVLLVGTDEDPQDLKAQSARLVQAGATVFYDVVDMVAMVERSCRVTEASELPPVSLESVQRPLAAINVGLESFYASVTGQGAEAIQVDWRPPAGGNEKMMALLARMKGGGK